MSEISESVNRRWRRRWKWQLTGSIATVALLHAALFVFSPTWEAKDPGAGGASGTVRSTAMTGVDQPAQAESMPNPPTPTPERPASEEPEPDARESDADSPAESVVESERPEASPREPLDPKSIEVRSELAVAGPVAGPDPGSESIRTLRRRQLPEPRDPSTFSTGGIATVAAEIAARSTSGWILIENPSAVQSFMEGVYATRRIDPAEAGAVSVALKIDEKGSVEDARIEDSSGLAELDRVVIELFEKIVSFRPARAAGTAVSTVATFSLSFPWF